MQLLKTNKQRLDPSDILQYIAEYVKKEVPALNRLKEYALGRNVAILSKKPVDPNNPDNKVPIPYGKKISTRLHHVSDKQ
jgi:hypothetical protein